MDAKRIEEFQVAAQDDNLPVWKYQACIRECLGEIERLQALLDAAKRLWKSDRHDIQWGWNEEKHLYGYYRRNDQDDWRFVGGTLDDVFADEVAREAAEASAVQ